MCPFGSSEHLVSLELKLLKFYLSYFEPCSADLYGGGLLKWKHTCLPERTPLKVVISYKKQNEIKKIDRLHNCRYLPDIFYNGGIGQFRNLWKPLILKTDWDRLGWPNILTRIYVFYLVFHKNYSIKCSRKGVIWKTVKWKGNKNMLPRDTIYPLSCV